MKKLYQLNWDILHAAELIGKLPDNAPVPQVLLNQIYKGDGRRLMGNGTARKWIVTMTTKAKALNGELHTHTMRYAPDQKIGLNTLINAVKGAWLDDCDKELADMDCISAEAVARVLV